jgi:hypothetical protein
MFDARTRALVRELRSLDPSSPVLRFFKDSPRPLAGECVTPAAEVNPPPADCTPLRRAFRDLAIAIAARINS